MHILALNQGQYGKRIVEHIQKSAPQEWSLESVNVFDGLPAVIDDPEDFLPISVIRADLLLGMTESSPAVQLLTALAKLCCAKAVRAPIDNPA